MQKPVLEIGLVAQRIGPAEHRVFGLLAKFRELRAEKKWTKGGNKKFRILMPRQQSNPANIIHILVEDGGKACSVKGLAEGTGLATIPEGQELHEQTSF